MISFKKDGVENLRGVAQKQFAHHQTARETDARGERSLTAPTHGPSAFGQCQQPLQAEAVCKRFRRIRTLSTHVMGRDGPQGASCRRAHEQGLLLSLQAALIGHWQLAAGSPALMGRTRLANRSSCGFRGQTLQAFVPQIVQLLHA